MNSFPIAVYIPSVVGISLIAMTTVFRRNVKGAIYFSLMSFSIAFWLVLQLIAQLRLDSINDLNIVRISSAASNLFPLFFLLFIADYLSVKISRKVIYTVFAIGLFMILMNFNSMMITKVDVTPYGIAVKEAGPLYFVQILGSFGIYLYGLYRLFKKSRKVDRSERGRYMILFFGISQALLVNIVGTTILVNSILIQIAMVESFLIMVGFIAYAIIKHKLFDIRLIVARSLGYILTFGTLIGIYVVAIFGVSTTLLGSSKLTTLQQLFYFAGTLLFGFTLQPLRKFFDRLTNRLFYRDAYDSQELLDKLNKILVGNIDLQPLLRQTSEILEKTLKAEFVAFIIKDVEGSSRRVIGSKKVALEEDQISDLSHHTKDMPMIIIADELDETHAKFKGVLSKNKVSVLARLAPTGKDANVLGYLVLGNKQSGNPYNKQDLQVLDIIANELVIAVQNAMRFEEIEAFTVTLQEKVNDATRQLRRTNEKLKALDETKDEFISMASHQLRTPLTAVKGYVSMVVEGDAGKLNKQQKELLDQAFSSSQRMVYLIADLLNVSRLKTGKFVIENKLTNLADVVEAEIEQLKQAAKGKNQTLTYSKPAKFIDLMLDETKMRQVIMNFTDNALHYTPKDGTIKVSLQDLGNSIEFTVVDDGLGVPKSEQHNLFTKFFRANNARRARPDGTGLGLFMAKKVVVAQGGAIIFTSQEGKGSTFGFTLPKNSTILPHTTTDTKVDSKPSK
ncbi:MAG: ATP-binding protein [Candidatus Saccharibacteria bacterium]